MLGTKPRTEAADPALRDGRGAFHRHRRCGVSHAGVDGKEDVGISNDKESEKLSHRKSKVS